jgi:thymidylate synthase
MMVAQVCELELGEFVHTFGDVHIYSNHEEQVEKQLARSPSALPTMKLNADVKDLFDFKFEDFELLDYVAQAAIKAPVAV